MSPSRTSTASPSLRARLRGLLRSAGRADARARFEGFERLEERVLLAGDEPNFNQVFGTGNPLTPVAITLDGQGVGTTTPVNGESTISPSGDSDVFSFIAPANEFVTVWADARNAGSTLNSRVEVYTGTVGGTATLVSQGSAQLPVTTGTLSDGWTGFVATAGTEYFVVVRSDAASGQGSQGDYILRIDALPTAFPTLDPAGGDGTVAGSITLPGGDIVYKVTTGISSSFNGVMTVLAKSGSAADLDPRIDIYNDAGLRIAFDSDGGNLTDAFLGTRSEADTTYYIRVRSDEFGDPLTRPSTGAFTLLVDAIGRATTVDPVTRLGSTGTQNVASAKDIDFFSFKAQGTGLSFITIRVGFPGAMPDSAVRIFDTSGVQIGFNELTSGFSRLEIQLIGGRNYYAVVENFGGTAGGAYVGELEPHHTYSTTSNPITDDHATTPTTGTAAEQRRQFELATPIIWGQPQDAVTPPFPGLPPVATPDHSQIILASATGRIHAPGDTDLFQFVVPIDMLGEYIGRDDGAQPPVPKLWRPNYRPATSLQILATAETLFNSTVRIFDSNLNVIYGPNTNVIAPFQDPSGILDPASFPPELLQQIYGYTFAAGQPARIDIWAGEVYYLEISGAGTGRYNVELQTDAPVDNAAVSTFGPAITKAGQFATAPEILIDPNSGEGDIDNNVAGGQVIALPGGNFIAVPGGGGHSGLGQGRTFAANLNGPNPPAAGTGATVGGPLLGTPGSRGRVIFRMSDLGIIKNPTDTELFQFRALYTGMAEVRLQTTQITDGFFENVVQSEDGDPLTPPVIEQAVSKTKTYNSPLDGALRIFDNDQTEIAYNNDNSVINGESAVQTVGAHGDIQFERRDPRVVFPVEAGRIYFIQVESGQAANFNLAFPKVDWRHAAGSYQLLVNSMSNLNFGDDHVNGTTSAQATPIPIDLNTTSTTAILGTVTGELFDTLANPDDFDVFSLIAPAAGSLQVTLSIAQAQGFNRTLAVTNNAGQIIGVAQPTGTDDGTVTVVADQGERFFIVVGSLDPMTPQPNLYSVSVSGIPFADDFASVPNFFGAYEIDKDLYDYDGTETVAGSIENNGDSDIFTFQSIDFDVATITVTSLSPGLAPLIRVYEIGEDGLSANPVLLQIAFGVGTISFSVTAPPRTSGASGETYNNYFAIVSGVDPDDDKGDYEFNILFNNTTDDHPDAGQYTIATPVPLTPNSPAFLATGDDTGSIELAGDTDLFTFTAPSQGRTTVSLVSDASSLLLPRIRIFDSSGAPVPDVFGQFSITGPDTQISTATFVFTALRNEAYFIQVEGVFSFGNVFKTEQVGAYSFSVVAPIPDDHANVGELLIATQVPISPFSGDGSSNGIIEIAQDSDLFQFSTVTNGNFAITINSPLNEFRPFLRLFDVNGTEIGNAVRDGGPGDEDGQLNGAVKRTLSGTLTGQTYFVLVSSDQTEPPSHVTGGYTVILDGARPPSGPDDHANAGDFISATLVPLDPRTGDAVATGNIEIAIDTDLFVFDSIAGSPARPKLAFVQITSPSGSLLDVGVRIFTLINGVHTQIASDTGGGAGVNAQVTFDIDAPNKKYWVEVDGLGGTDSYTVKIDTQPNTFFLYYPEGFANSVIREYVAVGNANPFAVNYSVRLKYADTSIPDVVINRTVAANSRGGVTISNGTLNPGSGVTFNKAYAIIVESDGFLGANLSHYDFGNTLGESFVGTPSTSWTFAQGQKLPGQVNDFLIYYNPNPTPAVVTLTAYQTDPLTSAVTSVAMSQIVQPFARRGWTFNDTALLPVGTFAFTVTSAPQTPGAEHNGIVASLSHYDLANSVGYALTGDPTGGSRAGVIPGLLSGATSTPFVTLFNPTNTVASVGLVGKYIDSALPNLIKNLTLQPFESVTLDTTALGLTPNQVIGLRYDSNTAITVLADTRAAGDADGTQANTDAATRFFFGDAFINRISAGTLYFENMYFYNPDTNALPITLTFTFNSGNVSTYTFNVGAKDFARVALHELGVILNNAVFNTFSIQASAASPFAVTMNHYDLVLAGGWGTKGAPLGPTVPLSLIL